MFGKNWASFSSLLYSIDFYFNSILYTPNFVYNEVTQTYVAKEYLPINFMHVVNPPQSGLQFLNKDHGCGFYIVHYAFTCVVAVTGVYIKPIIDWFKIRKQKENTNV